MSRDSFFAFSSGLETLMLVLILFSTSGLVVAATLQLSSKSSLHSFGSSAKATPSEVTSLPKPGSGLIIRLFHQFENAPFA